MVVPVKPVDLVRDIFQDAVIRIELTVIKEHLEGSESMIYKCKMCGGDLDVTGNEKIITCPFCGTNQTVPNVDEEKTLQLYNRATYLLSVNEYDKASVIYEKIIADQEEQAEAYWGLCLCKYGIEYVTDAKSSKKIATCHRTLTNSILKDNDYKKAIDLADSISKKLYEQEAKYIDGVQKKILDVSNNEEPYDIFICYKETTEDGNRTNDSVIAESIYDELTSKDFRVFFSRISLEDKIGQEYEPYIFSALRSAKIMMVIGTKKQYFTSPWIKNEWSRFLSMMKEDKNKILIPCYKDISPYEMPEEFVNLQSQDLGKIGFLQDLTKGIQKLISNKKNKGALKSDIQVLTSNLFAKANTALVKKEFAEADEFADQIIQLDPNNALAYLIKFKVECKMYSKELSTFLVDDNVSFYGNFYKAYELADEKLKKQLDDFRNEYEDDQKYSDYSKAVEIKRNAFLKDDYIEAYSIFEKLGDYRDSKKLVEECKKGINSQSEYMFLAMNLEDCIRPNMTNGEKNDLLSAFKYLKQMSTDEHLTEIINECDASSDENEIQKLEEEISIYKKNVEEFYKSTEIANLKKDYDEKKNEIESEISRLDSENTQKNNSIYAEKQNLRKEMMDLTTEISRCGIFQGKLKKELQSKLALLEKEYNDLKKNIYSESNNSFSLKINELKVKLSSISDEFNKKLDELKQSFDIDNKEKKIDEIGDQIKCLKSQKKYSEIWNPNPIITYKDKAGYNMAFITCGKYPKDKVTSYEIINKLNKLTPDQHNIVKLYGLEFMKYEDEYFIFKPIQWLVLSCGKISKEGKRVMVLLSRNCLDFKGIMESENLKIIEHDDAPFEYFNKRTNKPAPIYDGSDIDIFLNSEFFDIAFNDIEKKLICNVELDNSPDTTLDENNIFVCEKMIRKVFLYSARAISKEPFGDQSSQNYRSTYKDCSSIDSDARSTNGILWAVLCDNMGIDRSAIDINDKFKWDNENEARESSEHFRLRDSEFVQYKFGSYYNADKLSEESICNWMLRSVTPDGYGMAYVSSYDGEVVTDDGLGDFGWEETNSVKKYGIRPGIVICLDGATECEIASSKDNVDF